jgi:hypothetical protein
MIKTPFSKREGSCGAKWLTVFRRHHTLSFRQLESLFAAWIHGFSWENAFFIHILKREMFNIKYCPNWGTHVDGTGITTTFHKTRNVIGLKGKRRIWKTVTRWKGGSGNGCYMFEYIMQIRGQHPLLISRKNMKSELLDGTTAVTTLVGSIVTCTVAYAFRFYCQP